MNKEINYIYLLTMILILLSGCEKKVINLVLDLSDSYLFSVNETGEFSENVIITKQQIESELDLDQEVFIDQVNLESIAVQIAPLVGNEAQTIALSGYFEDQESQKTAVFEDIIISLSNYNQLTPLNGYVPAGVNLLTEKLKDYANDMDFSEFSLILEGAPIDNQGNNTDQLINLAITVEVNAAMVFAQDFEFPDL
ncbi:MAG: hypothetical protein ACNS62_19335 [Candidatus Cyclobacteriaceae bacterium M3_2C_046]